MKPCWTRVTWLGMCLGAALALACGPASAEQHPGSPTEEEEVVRTRVEVATLQSSDARLALSLTGEVEGWQDATLASALGGYVERVKAQAGDTVRAGQLIASVDAEIYRASLAQAQAQHELAVSEWERMQHMGDLVSESQLQQVQTQVRVTEAQRDQARAQARRARITAPFPGVIADVFVDPGEVAGPGSPVARIVTTDPVKVTLSVSDRDVVALRPGMNVSVTTAAQSGMLSGTVSHVGPAADMRTRAFPVEVRVDNPEKALRPGMIARVRVDQPITSGLLLPQDWVVTRRDSYGVFLEKEGAVQWRPLTLGAVVQGQIVVEEGLDVGDRVVMTGHRDLLDGDRVLVTREGTCCVDGRPQF